MSDGAQVVEVSRVTGSQRTTRHWQTASVPFDLGWANSTQIISTARIIFQRRNRCPTTCVPTAVSQPGDRMDSTDDSVNNINDH